MTFEHHSQPLLHTRGFLLRVLIYLGYATLVVIGFLILGLLGYHFFVGLAWLDAFLNAAMILSGMGPVDPVNSEAGKWFASFYALLSGLVFAVTTGIIISPIIHRVMHRLHLEKNRRDKRP
ncbi:MAG: hypothetical protein M1347_04055 [Chloroflexi bacterium]|nr:hypothetical protein [Chloroflexota bacterium]